MTHTDTETEHVARAICAAMGHDPDKRLQFDPTQIVDPPVMLRTMQPAWTFYAVQARAHIAAFNALVPENVREALLDAAMVAAHPVVVVAPSPVRPKHKSGEPWPLAPKTWSDVAHKNGPKAGED